MELYGSLEMHLTGPPNWSNPVPPPYDVSLKFTKAFITLYELVVPMAGGGGYKLIQEQGNWDTQYHASSGKKLGQWEF